MKYNIKLIDKRGGVVEIDIDLIKHAQMLTLQEYPLSQVREILLKEEYPGEQVREYIDCTEEALNDLVPKNLRSEQPVRKSSGEKTKIK
ncbi:MAG: hypothetical protein ACYDEJ_04175 [Desulfitobacteriaceae bacterium]